MAVERLQAALGSGDLAVVTGCFDPADAAAFQRRLLALARRLQPLGEADRLLSIVGSRGLDELAEMDPGTFLRRLLSGAFESLGAGSDVGEIVVVGLEQSGPDDATLTYAIGAAQLRAERSVRLQRRGPTWWLRFDDEALARRIASFESWAAEFEARCAQDVARAGGSEELEPFAVWGYRNQSGEVVIAPRFGKAGEFADGLAPVRLLSQWGYVDARGRLAIPARFVRAREFSEGLGAAATGDARAPRWGFLETSGEWAIAPRFADASSFSRGLAAARDETGQWGYIDREGTWSIAPRFESAAPFDDEGRAEVELAGEPVVIDRYGQVQPDLD